MLKKIVQLSVIGALLIALIGGTAYVLINPQDTEAGWAGGQNRQAASQPASEVNGTGYSGGDRGATEPPARNERSEALAGNAYGEGLGQGKGPAQGANGVPGAGALEGAIGAGAWEQIQGIVTEMDHDLMIKTTDGTEILVGLGPETYREQESFILTVGDEVIINGYEEDGEFKASVVENLTSGERIILRDEAGRPMWGGWRGRGN